MGEQGLTLFSPAKVNLFLRVLSRREDGYHSLASLFQAINLVDTLHVRIADTDTLTCTVPGIPLDRTNLIWKAADLFRRKTALSFHVCVHLEKHIPIEAGLGGGSSNAATMLWALNELFGRPASLLELITWSAEIGSDITFFLSQGTAYCTGRGEVILSLPSLPNQNLWIVKPTEGLPTPQVYRRVEVHTLPNRNPEESLAACRAGQPHYYNDLEPAAFAVQPSLGTLKQRLLHAGFSHVLMCGSGSSFACFGEGAPPFLPGVAIYPARFINRLPGRWYTSLRRDLSLQA